MRKTSFISSFRWLLLAVVCFIALDRWLASSDRMARFLENYTDIAFDNPVLFYEKLRTSFHQENKPLVIVLGSSAARESIDEQIVEADLGGKVQVLNLGFFHGRDVDFWMLSDYFAALHPDLVVMALGYDELYLEYSYHLTFPYYFRVRKAWELLGPGELLKNWREVLPAALARASFLYRYRASIGNAALRWLKEEMGFEPWYHRGRFRFSEEREVLPTLDEKLTKLGQAFNEDTSRLNIRAMQRVIGFFREKSVPVTVLKLSPHPKFQSEIDRLHFTSLMNWRNTVLAEAQTQWGQASGVTNLVPPPSLWKNKNYADYLHLNADGRAEFSHWFASWLREQPKFGARP